MKKATIRDVAALAGVSISAVSYILNGSEKKKYSDATVQAVRAAAAKLQYAPNSLARGMRSQKAHAIGIVNFWENASPIFAKTLRSVAEAASERSYATVICTGAEDYSYLHAFSSRTVDAIVLFAPTSVPFNERAHIREMQKMSVPFAIVNGNVHAEGVPALFYDYGTASRLGVELFLEKGRKKIAYVDEFSEEAARELRDRREGYTEAMIEAGLEPKLLDLRQLDLSDLSGVEAVVTSRAETARALMRRLLDEGIRVPDAFDLFAGSEEEAGCESYLPLTGAGFPFAEAGAYVLTAALDGVTASRTLSPQLYRGKTVRGL